jgi:hypothetical protein
MTFVKGKILYLIRHNTPVHALSGGRKDQKYTAWKKGITVHHDELKHKRLSP